MITCPGTTRSSGVGTLTALPPVLEGERLVDQGCAPSALLEQPGEIGVHRGAGGRKHTNGYTGRNGATFTNATNAGALFLVLDDALITSDDRRAAHILRALVRFAEGGQVLVFTHHRHLLDLARVTLGEQAFTGHML